jgi:threonine dehydrogenase-like Zn-dependent dehydrogenase
MVEMSKYVPWRKPMDLSRDVVFGHEFCGEILEYGSDTKRKLKPGARVVSIPRIMVDGKIDGIGYSNTNIGAYSERFLVSEDFMLEVPDHVTNELAALTEPLSIGIHALAKADPRPGEVPLVIGCGPIGLAVIAALSYRGIHPIIASDYSPRRRELAAKLGADIVVDPAAHSAFKAWEENARLSAEEFARLPFSPFVPPSPLKPALIFECVGVPGILQSVIEGAAQSARIIVVGVCMEEDRQIPMFASYKELSMQYVLGCTPSEFAQSLELIASGTIDAGAMITDTVGLDEVPAAFDELASPNRHTKIVVQPWRS